VANDIVRRTDQLPSVNPLVSTNTWFVKTILPLRSVRETSGSPSGTSISWLVIGSLTRMGHLLPHRRGSRSGAENKGLVEIS